MDRQALGQKLTCAIEHPRPPVHVRQGDEAASHRIITRKEMRFKPLDLLLEELFHP